MVTTNSIDCTSDPWLSRQERLLITSFRAMKDSAKHMMVDLAEDLAEALPAAPTALAPTTSGAVDARQSAPPTTTP